MGRLLGPTSTSIAAAGFFRGSGAAPPPPPSFMVVGAGSSNPLTAVGAACSWRDHNGVWHKIDATAIGARGLFGVTHSQGIWYVTSNAPSAQDSVVGTTADGAPPGALTATDTTFTDHLTAITDNTTPPVFFIGTLSGNIVNANRGLSIWGRNSANGPSGYTVLGIAQNGLNNNFACVGIGSAGTGVCHSTDGENWTNQTVGFSTQNDGLVTSNTVIWDGAQFVAASNAQVITSANGTTWTTGSLTSAVGNVVTFDAVNGIYYVGCIDGSVLHATTIAGLATAVPRIISGGVLRCAASIAGVTILGDDSGNVFRTSNGGTTWVTENPGLGAVVLTGAAANT